MPPSLRLRIVRLIAHVRTPLYFNAYAMMLSNTVSSVLGILYWALAARLYGAQQVGIDSALISIMLFLAGLSQLNLRVALNRLIPEAGALARRLIFAAYGISLVVTALVSIAFVAMFGVVGAGSAPTDLGPGLALAFIMGTMAWTIFNLQDGVLSGMRQARWIPVENALYGLAKIALLVVLAVTLQDRGVLLSWIIPMVGAVLLTTMFIVRRLLPAYERAAGGRRLSMGPRRLFRFVAIDYVASLFALGYVTLLPILVVSRLGPTAGGHFYIVWAIVTSLNLIPLSMAASMTVETVTGSDDPLVQARQALGHMLRLLVPLVVAALLGAPFVLSVFGEEYAAAGSEALRLFAVGVIPYSVAVVFFAVARICGRSGEVLLVQAALAALILGTSYQLLDLFGITGVAVSWLLSQTVIAFVLLATRLRPILRSKPTGASA